MGETDVNQMVSSEVLGEQTMGTYLLRLLGGGPEWFADSKYIIIRLGERWMCWGGCFRNRRNKSCMVAKSKALSWA